MTTVSKIYSILGSDSSLIPLALKDVANSAGMTTGSYITGNKLEGKDRFIDEFGTGAIWLGGVPAFKKLIDWTVFKIANIDPAFDMRNFKNKEILEIAAENSPVDVGRILKNEKLVKGLNTGKFAAATLFTIASYNALTNFRHNHTKESAKKELLAQKEQFGPRPSFKSFAPSFTGVGDVMANAVQNTMVVDVGITGLRLGKSQTPQEFVGYTIKEGGIWAFMYLIQKPLRLFFEKQAMEKGKCIALDSKVIEGDTLKNFLKSPDLKSVPTDDVGLYKFLISEKTNPFVQMAKESGLVKTYNDAVDTRRFIDLDAVRGVKASLEKLCAQYTSAADKDKFLGELRQMKRAAVLKNIGASTLALGIAVPALIMASRFLLPGNKEFKAKELAAKELNSG